MSHYAIFRHMAWCVLISSHDVHKDREVYIVAVLKPVIVICFNVECFVLISRMIHCLCMDKTFGDIDAVEMRCMDHVLVSSDYVKICEEWSELFTWTLFSRDGNKWLDYHFTCGSL